LSYLKSLGREEAMLWESGQIGGGGALRLGHSSDANLHDVFIDPQTAVVATMSAVSPPATGETMAAFDSFDSTHGKAVGRHGNRAGAEDVPPKSAVLDLSSIDKGLRYSDRPNQKHDRSRRLHARLNFY
jgi:hypothetical protein